jgi:hypothetical protein
MAFILSKLGVFASYILSALQRVLWFFIGQDEETPLVALREDAY